MRIRCAEAGDAPEIVAIWNAFIRDTTVTFTSDYKTVEAIAADIAARGAGFQVAEADGALIGFATCFPFRSGSGYARTFEHSIMLAEGTRGRGAGRALMAAICAQATASGAHSLWAVISAENPQAVAFHAALGFAEIARLHEVGYKFERWIDAILMQKML